MLCNLLSSPYCTLKSTTPRLSMPPFISCTVANCVLDVLELAYTRENAVDKPLII